MFFGNFFLTLALEWPVFAWLSKRGFRATFGFMVLMNLVTWPIATVLYTSTTIPLWIIELGVWVAESLIIFLHWRTTWWRGVFLAFCINACSWGIGSFLLYLFER